MALLYKTLFRISILHEYYLTASDGQTVFDKNTPEERTAFLINEFAKGRSSINNDLEFIFPPALTNEYENAGLRILPAYSGCKVVVRVKQEIQNDGSSFYKPMSPLPKDLPIFVLANKKSNLVDSYTNQSSTSIPCIHYFSNDNPSNDKIFPALNSPIAPYDSSRSYEQGELASFGSNDIRQFAQGNPTPEWVNVMGSYVSSADKTLVPLSFDFTFRNPVAVTQAQYSLTDPDGTELVSRSVNTVPPEQKVKMNFSAVAAKLMKTGGHPYISGECRLKVTGTGGYEQTQNIRFSDVFYSRSNWAVFEFIPVPGDTRYSLLDSNGFIHQRKDPSGVITQTAPSFELPVKSRYAFWRFINNRGDELKLTSVLQDYLVKEGRVLITRSPVSLTRSYFMVPGQGGAVKKFLPNPTIANFKLDNKRRVCLDVIVPQSDLFPIII